jgi:hypothetical protein
MRKAQNRVAKPAVEAPGKTARPIVQTDHELRLRLRLSALARVSEVDLVEKMRGEEATLFLVRRGGNLRRLWRSKTNALSSWAVLLAKCHRGILSVCSTCNEVATLARMELPHPSSETKGALWAHRVPWAGCVSDLVPEIPRSFCVRWPRRRCVRGGWHGVAAARECPNDIQENHS